MSAYSATLFEVARPRSVPALICAPSAPSASTTPSMWPPRSAVTAGAAPVWGTGTSVDAGERVDEPDAELPDRARAGMADVHLAWILLRVARSSSAQRPVRRVGAHRQHAGRPRRDAQRHQILLRVVRHRLRIDRGTKGERAVLREEDRSARPSSPGRRSPRRRRRPRPGGSRPAPARRAGAPSPPPSSAPKYRRHRPGPGARRP